ncbi:MAG: histidine phosphatase family protein [Chitinophagaceae bacterium]|nr:histidine phosphatase family protein [Chitinophagaceae bacterium]
MLTLILVRHGETLENGLKIAQGQTDGTLTEKGKAENDTLGKGLQQFSFRTIYSSPLGRALQTAEAIHHHNPEAALVTDDRLMERHLGILQGEKYPEGYKESDTYEGVESAESMAERMSSFLSFIKQKHTDETIVMVSHGYVIKVFLSLVNNWPVEEFHKVQLMNNSAYILVTL